MKKLILALALIGLVSGVSLVKANQAVNFATVSQNDVDEDSSDEDVDEDSSDEDSDEDYE